MQNGLLDLNMFALLIALGSIVVASGQGTRAVTGDQKEEFIQLLKSLPTAREFFTDDAVDKAAPYIRVLLSLTEKDIEKYDPYPFLAISRGLLDRKEHRAYGIKHFDEIAHPTIKLFWGAVLFEEKSPSPEIVRFLRIALESKKPSKVLSEILGPDFNDFRKRVKEYSLTEQAEGHYQRVE